MYSLYNGNCLEEMKKIESNSVNLILTDPPYGVLHSARKKNNITQNKQKNEKYSWDKLPDLNLLIEQWKRILTDSGTIVMTIDLPAGFAFYNAMPELFKQDAVWCKNNKTNFANSHIRLMRQHENIFIFSKGSAANGANNNYTYNPQNLIKVNKVRKNEREFCGLINAKTDKQYIQKYTNYPSTLLKIDGKRNRTNHATEKPIELFEYLLLTYSNENDTVLDCFMGSGTTGICAVKNNRKFIGIELTNTYYNLSKQRIEQYIKTGEI